MDMTGKKLLFKAYHGSHLYGLNTPKSDTDYKGIVIPSREELKNNTAPGTCYDDSVQKAKNQKNTSVDTDTSYFTLKAFLRLCAEGQSMAVEMLFTPRELWVESSPEWEFLVANRDKLIHKNMGSFFNMARKQAYKYSVKGERIEANKVVLAWANSFHENDKLDKHLDSLKALVEQHKNLVDTEKQPLIKFVICIGPRGEDVLHLEVSNRKSPLTVMFKHFKKGLEKTLSQYGHRALQANQMGGADFKALSHAVRVGYEALELLQTHKLTFPMVQKDELLAMKQGQWTFPDIESKIEALLLEIREKELHTTLPDSIDKEFWDKWLKHQYNLQRYPKWLAILKNVINR